MTTGHAPTLKDCSPHVGGEPIRVGDYTVYAGGTWHLTAEVASEFDVLVSLNGDLPKGFNPMDGLLNGYRLDFGDVVELDGLRILGAAIPDYQGPPPGWREFLEQRVIPELEAGRKVLAFCSAGHGRTGTFLASLVALLERRGETPDPVFAVRQRHCCEAVETMDQVEAVFALRGEAAPKRYLTSVRDTPYRL